MERHRVEISGAKVRADENVRGRGSVSFGHNSAHVGHPPRVRMSERGDT